MFHLDVQHEHTYFALSRSVIAVVRSLVYTIDRFQITYLIYNVKFKLIPKIIQYFLITIKWKKNLMIL